MNKNQWYSLWRELRVVEAIDGHAGPRSKWLSLHGIAGLDAYMLRYGPPDHVASRLLDAQLLRILRDSGEITVANALLRERRAAIRTGGIA